MLGQFARCMDILNREWDGAATAISAFLRTHGRTFLQDGDGTKPACVLQCHLTGFAGANAHRLVEGHGNVWLTGHDPTSDHGGEDGLEDQEGLHIVRFLAAGVDIGVGEKLAPT